jgi:hypothetical protein
MQALSTECSSCMELTSRLQKMNAFTKIFISTLEIFNKVSIEETNRGIGVGQFDP